MGEYYGVRAVIENGEYAGTLSEPQPLIPSDEALIAILFNGTWAVAPDVTEKGEYEYFRDARSRGIWSGSALCKLPKSKLPSCPDEGKVYSTDLKKILKGREPEIKQALDPFNLLAYSNLFK